MKRRLTAVAVSIVMGAFMAGNSLGFQVYAQHNDIDEDNSIQDALQIEYEEKNTYSDYYDEHINDPRPDSEIFIRAVDYITAEDGQFSKGKYGPSGDVREDVLIWNSVSGRLSYQIDVKQAGIYNMAVSYCPVESTSTSIDMSVLIDGETPFDTAGRIALNRVWVNEKEITCNSQGNQIRPAQKQYSLWMKTDIKDSDGLFNDPLGFYLSIGKHTITFEARKADIALEYIKLYNQASPAPYSESAPDNSELQAAPSLLIRLEGENAAFKSDSTLYPTSDKSSYLTSPCSPGKMVYNTIGDQNWKKALQTITWIIPGEEIKGDGWYRIGIKARQQTMRGLYSNRRIYVDDEITCSELSQVRFYYDTDWSVVSPSDENGNDIYVYLTAGEDHTITMEAIPGEIGESMRQLEPLVDSINRYYRKILMVTGPTPDKYTDYNVTKNIPELTDELTSISSQLKNVKKSIESLSGSTGSEAAGIERMYVILDKCIKNPEKIPGYLKQIKDNSASISSWMRDYKDQPLEVDYIEIASYDRNFSGVRENAVKSAGFAVKAFFVSFFQDYSMISEKSDGEVLDVWVNLGRDQALAIKELTESDFIPDSGISVNLSIVQGGVVEAALAGKAPDAVLYLDGEFPVNLAARGLLCDLNQFDGIKESLSQFNQDADTIYRYNDGLYALPLSQTFPMMFYRKDILYELGIDKVPQTWDDIIDILPVLQRNYMYAGLVLPSTNIAPSTEPGHTFALLMLQNGLGYYNDTLSQTTFSDVEAVHAFETWTDFYTKYKFEQIYDPFSRFRDGTYPIVIQPYTFFNQLKTAAPEINGLWDFTCVPGTLTEDGEINHAVNSSGSGAVIFEESDKKEEAWQFIKWFASSQTQTEYAALTEGLLGTLGRCDTANQQAFANMSWTPDETSKIMQQWNQVKEIPVIPAAYAVTRNIMTAFRTTVNKHQNARDTLLWYNRDINTEIKRKRANLGIDRK
ncbi:MAG: extracellular solute-binding protein [Oscillospiraceae bacterium]|nr:extracellular solute-binding protein [Oscillospiraceae bacterium]